MNSTVHKSFFVLLLAVLSVGGIYAQTWYDSYAPAIEDNTLFANAGVGIGPTGGWGIGIPPLSVSVDYRLPIDLPITAGGIVTFTTWKRSLISTSSFDLDMTYMNIGFGVRVMYHFNFLEILDTYAGVTLGYVYQKVNAEGSNGFDYGAVIKGDSFILWGINIGARFFFTDYIGAYMELGYSGLQIAGIGLSLKF